MGREAKAYKERTCWKCGETFVVTAREIKAHARECQEMTTLLHKIPVSIQEEKGETGDNAS